MSILDSLVFQLTCPYCQHPWTPKTKNRIPQSCPACKQYLNRRGHVVIPEGYEVVLEYNPLFGRYIAEREAMDENWEYCKHITSIIRRFIGMEIYHHLRALEENEEDEPEEPVYRHPPPITEIEPEFSAFEIGDQGVYFEGDF